MSLVLGGWAGMRLNRQVGKGLVFGVAIGLALTCATGAYGLGSWYIVTLVDAILIARRLNRGEPVRDWQFF